MLQGEGMEMDHRGSGACRGDLGDGDGSARAAHTGVRTVPSRAVAGLGVRAAPLVIALLWPGLVHAQPADGTAEAMNARLAAAHVTRVGPSYLYPAHDPTPGLVNPDITPANIAQTICNPHWSTKSIRPPVTYTDHLKAQQLAASNAGDKTPGHYEEDHLVSLELGGDPRDRRNLWPERWGTPGHPLTSKGPFPAHLVGAKAKDATESALHAEVCHGTLTLRQAQYIIATDWFKYYGEKVLK